MKKFLSVFLSLALLVTGLSCSIVPTSAYTEPTVKTDYSDCIKFDADHWGVGGGSNGLSFSAGSVHHNQSAWKTPYTTIEGLAPYTDYTLTFTYNSTCGDEDDSTQVTLYQGPHIVAKDNNLTGNVDSNGYKNKSAVISTYTSETGTFGNDDTKVTVKFTTTAETTYHLFISIGQCGNAKPEINNATFHANNFTLDINDANDYTSHIIFDDSHWGAGYWAGLTVDSLNKTVKNNPGWQYVYTMVDDLLPHTEYVLSFDLSDNSSIQANNFMVIEKDPLLTAFKSGKNESAFTNNGVYKGSNTNLLPKDTVLQSGKKVTFYFTTADATSYNLLLSAGDCGTSNNFIVSNFSLKIAPSRWKHEHPGKEYTKGTDGYTPITTDTNNWNGVFYELKNLKANTAYTAVVNYKLDENLQASNDGFQFNHCMVTDLKFTPDKDSNFQTNGYYQGATDYELYWHAVAHSTIDKGVKTDRVGSVNNDTENKQLIYKFTTATAGTYTLLTKLGGTALSLADPVVTEDTELNAEQTAIDQNFSFLGSAIRLASGSKSQALRFKAQVNKAALADKAIAGQTVTEYGFVVFTKSLMPVATENLYIGLDSFGWEKKAISAAAYKKDGNTDIIFAEDDNTKQFTAALTNITENNYSKDYVVRIYVKLSNGHTHYVTVPDDITDGVQYYQSSIAAVAQLALEDTNAGYSEADKTTLQEIVTKGGEQ